MEELIIIRRFIVKMYAKICLIAVLSISFLVGNFVKENSDSEVPGVDLRSLNPTPTEFSLPQMAVRIFKKIHLWILKIYEFINEYEAFLELYETPGTRQIWTIIKVYAQLSKLVQNIMKGQYMEALMALQKLYEAFRE